VTLRVVFRPEAETELLEARYWYDKQHAGLGQVFGSAVEAAITSAVQNPFAYPRVHSDTRRVLVKRFPYAVYFQVLPEELVVLALIHGRRHPRRWQARS
jgi:plasmid stabilization system protein ParE